MYRNPVYVSVLTFGLLLTAACGRNDNRAQSRNNGEARTESRGEASRETTSGTAFVRFVSAADAHSGTDLYVGNQRLFSAAEAKTPTEYKQVPAERVDIVLREAGKQNGAEVEKNSEGLDNGKHYTVVVYEDKDAKPVMRVINDDEPAPAAGKAKLRIIHAAPAAEPVGLYVAGKDHKLAGESRFSTVSGWEEVDPVNGPLEVRTGNGRATARIDTARLEPGKLYTFIVEGGPKSGKNLRVIQMVDTPSRG